MLLLTHLLLIYLQLPPLPDLPYLGKGIEPPLVRHKNGRITRKSLREVDLSTRIRFVGRLVLNDPNNAFTDVITIPNARCPVVRFVHSPTGMKCDLTINNR